MEQFWTKRKVCYNCFSLFEFGENDLEVNHETNPKNTYGQKCVGYVMVQCPSCLKNNLNITVPKDVYYRVKHRSEILVDHSLSQVKEIRRSDYLDGKWIGDIMCDACDHKNTYDEDDIQCEEKNVLISWIFGSYSWKVQCETCFNSVDVDKKIPGVVKDRILNQQQF